MEGTGLNSAKTKAFLETYEILEELGSGTGGTVRKAYHKNLEKYVVIKKMHQSAAEVLNKRTETDALKNLRFQYIPQVLDFLELEDGIYTVMDYVPGSSFKSLVQEGKSFTQKQVLKYALELFETLDYIHTRTPKIIHGDIKPENLMLTPDDNICLIDFNISNISDDAAIVEGYTKGYASPEQIQSFEEYSQWMQKNMAVSKLFSDDDGKTELIVNDDEGTLLLSEEEDKTEVIKDPLKEEKFVPSVHIDERADIYSACATIYYILTGEKPSFSGGKLVEPVKIRPKVSEGLNYLIVHGMEWERDKRFKTASDVVKVLNNINKLDKRYKRLVLSQNVLFATAVALIALGVVFLNQARLFSERADKQRYDEILEEMEEAAYLSEADSSTLEKLYEESILLDSNRIDAYYTYGTILYLQKNYEKVIEFIEENVLYNTELSGQGEMDEIYYILGSSYAKENTPDYKMALLYLQKAIDNGNSSSRCYRELAECYLALDDVQNAENILNKAKDEGQLSADMLLLSGQINCIKGEVESAIADYKECILQTDDEEILLRSYLGLNAAYLAENKDEISLKNAVSIMEEAITHITGNNQAQLLQTQTQNYIDLFNLTGEEKYALSAIETINKAITSGWGDLDNYLNLAFLYEQIDDYDRAKEILLGLLDKYPDNYAVYKRLSFLEADIQNSLPSENRDYKDFDTYYKAAKESFEKQDEVNSDVEMQMLDDMYLDAVNSGWIK